MKPFVSRASQITMPTRAARIVHGRAGPARRGRRAWAVVVTLAAVALGGCVSLPAAAPARMVPPPALAAETPMTMGRLAPSRQGDFEWMARKGRFERQADRLALFDAALEFDRVGVRYTLGAPDHPVSAQCRGRRTGAAIGIVAASPRPLEVLCTYGGAFSGTFTFSETTAAAGTRVQRQGRLQWAGVALEVSSVHHVEGSALPLASPIGYTFASAGHMVAAVEVNGSTPRLWLGRALEPSASASGADLGGLREAVLHAALTLALLWDPALTAAP
jgi:hypothetical protein